MMERMTIAIDPETRGLAVRLAKRMGISISALIRMLIRKEWEKIGGGTSG